MSMIKCRHFSYRVLSNLKQTALPSYRNYYAHENVVPIGTEQDRNSDNFQVVFNRCCLVT